jgi:hypothetical protein
LPSLIPTRPGAQRKHDKHDAPNWPGLPRRRTDHGRTPRRRRSGSATWSAAAKPSAEPLKSRHYPEVPARRGFFRRQQPKPNISSAGQLGSANSPLAYEDRWSTWYLALLEYKLARRTDLDRQIELLALTPALARAVGYLQCFRGIQLHSAMVLACELVDWRRFATPGQLMAYLGLVSREHSSGERERRGSITKAGNRHCRHVLVQAGWAYRHQPRTSAALKARQKGQPANVITHAWKAQHRLHKLYAHLAYRKSPQIAVVAVARELSGFLWAVMRELEPATATPLA